MLPTSDHSFSIIFDSWPYNLFLFATGDKTKWLICDKSQVHDNWSHGVYNFFYIINNHLYYIILLYFN